MDKLIELMQAAIFVAGTVALIVMIVWIKESFKKRK
jgi:hypothetical protein